MLCLSFLCEKSQYAISAERVVEVIPWVELSKIPSAPESVAGLFNYRGELTPVVDMIFLLTDKPAERLLSSRIVLVRYPVSEKEERLLGILLERVMETVRIEDEDLIDTGINLDQAPYLTDAALKNGNIIKMINIEMLLHESMCGILFTKNERA